MTTVGTLDSPMLGRVNVEHHDVVTILCDCECVSCMAIVVSPFSNRAAPLIRCDVIIRLQNDTRLGGVLCDRCCPRRLRPPFSDRSAADVAANHSVEDVRRAVGSARRS